MTDKRPVWLLDVDGVVNAVIDKRRPDTWSWDSWHKYRIPLPLFTIGGLGRVSVWTPDELVAFINRVHDEGLAEIQWCTTWQDLAPMHLAPRLGLHRFPNAMQGDDRTRYKNSGLWWKEGKAMELYESGRRVIWTDDHIAARSDCPWAFDAQVRTLDPVTTNGWAWQAEHLLAISPIEEVGLTPLHTELIEQFLKQ